jgi:hypothetical protein
MQINPLLFFSRAYIQQMLASHASHGGCLATNLPHNWWINENEHQEVRKTQVHSSYLKEHIAISL